MMEDWVFYGTPIQFSNAVESYWNLKTPRIPCRVIEQKSNGDRVVLQILVPGIRAWITAHTIPKGRSKLVISSAGDEEKDNTLKQHWDDLVIELRRQGWQINVYVLNQNQDDLSTGTLMVPNEIPWIAYGNPYTGGTAVVDQITGQPWKPPSPLSIVGREQVPNADFVPESLSTAAATPSNTSPSTMILAQFNKLLRELFSESDLKDFCLALNIDYESLPGDSKADKTRELILELQRRGRIPELLTLVKQERPHISWPDAIN